MVGVIALAASHLMFVLRQLSRPRRVSPDRRAAADVPALRANLRACTFAILFGGFIAMALGSNLGVLSF